MMVPGYDRRMAAVMLGMELAFVAIAGAWLAELVLGSVPCKLCLVQRWPYYIGLPMLVASAWCFGSGKRPAIGRALAICATLTFLVSLGLAVYHSGVEWAFWAGPSDCGGGRVTPTASTLEDFRKSLDSARVVNCAQASGRVLGLSFAGWNVVVSALVMACALRGARRA